MKTIAILLAILVASIAAQDMAASVVLRFNNGQTPNTAGVISIFQPFLTEHVQIQCISFRLLPRAYFIAVHDGRGFTDDCSSLGPILEMRYTKRFYFPKVIVIDGHTVIEDIWSSRILVPLVPHGLKGHVIALYDNYDQVITTDGIYRPVACGAVTLNPNRKYKLPRRLYNKKPNKMMGPR